MLFPLCLKSLEELTVLALFLLLRLPEHLYLLVLLLDYLLNLTLFDEILLLDDGHHAVHLIQVLLIHLCDL